MGVSAAFALLHISLIRRLGDDERVRVWNTTTFRTEITLSRKSWAQITCLTWIYVDSPVDDKCTILAVGTGRGTVTLCLMTEVAPVCDFHQVIYQFTLFTRLNSLSPWRLRQRRLSNLTTRSRPWRMIASTRNLQLHLTQGT